MTSFNALSMSNYRFGGFTLRIGRNTSKHGALSVMINSYVSWPYQIMDSLSDQFLRIMALPNYGLEDLSIEARPAKLWTWRILSIQAHPLVESLQALKLKA